MKYTTSIDTVGLQVYSNNEVTRNFIVDGILTLLYTKKLYVLEKTHSTNMHSNFFIREYHICSNSTTIASIRMGSFSMNNPLNNMVVTTYYIAIKFAGLKRYHEPLDTISHNTLLSVCAYLNTRNITYKLTELDVCMDMYTRFENVLALCTKKFPKTTYYPANESQLFETTSYIEKITNDKLDEVLQRAYLYDKSKKENLPYQIVRFELKLQAKFFNNYRNNLISSILNALHRYHVMYVPLKKEKNYLLQQYDTCAILRERDIKRIGFEKYRCYPDTMAIHAYITNIFSIKERDLIQP
ncbi:MAG: hypothetical protein PHX13_04970 [Thiovulaceae bacterium]|jgi:hypothetical protein|nr:hypothetical protein [Sulfurimonadaceae bacterium]